jgi:hypothetical protein
MSKIIERFGIKVSDGLFSVTYETRDYRRFIKVEKVARKLHNKESKSPLTDDFPEMVEARHGRWYQLADCLNEGLYCSVCAKKQYECDPNILAIYPNYCPNCGAKMDGERKEQG